MPKGPSPAVGVAVAISNRAVRIGIARSLEAAGYRARAVSRPAELAKALRDESVCLVVTTDHAADVALTAPTHAAPRGAPMLTLAQGTTEVARVTQILAALTDQATSSA